MDTIYGVFTNIESADRVLTKLAAFDYGPNEISVIVREDIDVKRKTEVGKGTSRGAVAGGIAGGLTGLLFGIGAIAVAGFSPLLIAGPLAGALGITAAVATTIEGAASGIVGGGLVGALVGLGIPKETAESYGVRIKEGEVLLGVPVKKDIDQSIVMKIFEDEKAEDIYSLMV